jgi:hypothetical protein
MAGGSENGGHDQRAMEEGKEEYPAADQGCAMTSVPFLQKVRGHVQDILLNSSWVFLSSFLFGHLRLTTARSFHLSFCFSHYLVFSRKVVVLLLTDFGTTTIPSVLTRVSKSRVVCNLDLFQAELFDRSSTPPRTAC